MTTYILPPGGASTVTIGNVPSFVPNPGQFASVPATNNAVDVNPAGYPVPGAGGAAGSMADAFTYWTRKFAIPDLDANPQLPGYGVYGSGHTSMFQPMLRFSTAQLKWLACSNLPSQKWLEPTTQPSPTYINIDLEFNDPSNTWGTTSIGVPCASSYAPHTYAKDIVIPSSAGGGPQGTLFVMGLYGWNVNTTPAGPANLDPSVGPASCHGLDISKASMGYSKLTPTNSSIAFNAQGPTARPWSVNDFVTCDWDPTRNGIWIAATQSSAGGQGVNSTVLITGFAPGQFVTQQRFQDGGPWLAGAILKYYPAADMLLVWYRNNLVSGAGTLWGKRLTGPLSSNPFVSLNVTGQGPFSTAGSVSSTWPMDVGLTYSTQLGCFFAYDAGSYETHQFTYGPNRVFKLTPPAVGHELPTDTAPNTWTWSSQDFTSADGTNLNTAIALIGTQGFQGPDSGFLEIPGWSRPGQATFLICLHWSQHPAVFVSS
jgi:hypothetical protein